MYWETRTKVIVSIVVIVAVVVCLIWPIATFVRWTNNDHDYVGTVTKLERHENGYYLVFTKDQEGNDKVLKNGDVFWRGKWNSSDLYAKLEVGKTYKFHLIGWRNNFMSWYEVILSFEDYQPTKAENQNAQTNAQTDKLTITQEVTAITDKPYKILIDFESESGISVKKMYKAQPTNELDIVDNQVVKDTIMAKGTDFFGNSATVSENGVYWLYIKEVSGNEYTQRFIIENFE